jgi:hypothetical protein
MSTYDSIAWLPLCAGLTALGLVLTYTVARRRGWRAMLHGAAWSLLPIAAYLTGSIEMFWKIGTAIGNFAAAFAFSPEKWAGIGVAGLAAVAFGSSGGRKRRKAARGARRAARVERKKGAVGTPDTAVGMPGTAVGTPGTATADSGTRALAKPDKQTRALAKPGRGTEASPPDDDLKDIEEILRKRGL